MAFDKAKVLKAAEKFLAQGKIDLAIKEYRQIVENDEDDLTTLNMLGDLCVRAGKKDEAVSCFQRIAEHYRDQQFNLKAIAMFKKVERLKPHDSQIAESLAALYAEQGLVVDARAQYLTVAEAYTKNGQTKLALEVLRKIADLDPRNTNIRLKLANGYLKEGLGQEACDAFEEAAKRLHDAGEFEQALDAYNHALELRRFDETILAGLLSTHTELGSADEAAELLEKVVAERPDMPQLVPMLATAYLAAEDAPGAERATQMLMALDASDYARFVPVAHLYLKSSDIDATTRLLASIVEQMLAGREENQLLELVNEVLARNPEHIEGLRLLARIHWWQRDMEKLRSVLDRLLEAAQAAESVDDERYALTQLARLVPDETRYLERLEELGGVQEDLAQTSFANEPAAADVPSFETFASLGDPSVATQPATAEFETNSVAEPALTDPNASFAELNEEVQASPTSETSDLGAGFSGAVEFDFSAASAKPAEATEPAAAEEAEGGPRHEAMMRQELESVDFYLSQSYLDIAEDTLKILESQFGSHPEIDARRKRLGQLQAGLDSDSAIGNFEISAEPEKPARAEEEIASYEIISEPAASDQPARAGGSVDSPLADVFEEFKLEAEEDADSNQDYETHYNMGTAYKEMDLLDEAIQEFQIAVSLSKPSDGTSRFLQCCNMLGHCFTQKNMPRAAVLWFKKGLDAPGHSEDEYLALRYELGAAYEQMGDLSRAIDTFTEVYGVNISYRGVDERLRDLQQQKNASGKGKKRKR